MTSKLTLGLAGTETELKFEFAKIRNMAGFEKTPVQHMVGRSSRFAFAN